MKIIIIIRRLLLIGTSFFIVSCSSIPNEQMCGLPESEIRNAVVHIIASDKSTASGVVISPGRVISVAHAFRSASEISIAIDGDLNRANLVYLDKGADLALLEVDTGSITPMVLSEAPLVKDETLWALGYPLNNAQKLSLGLFKHFFEDQLYTTNHINSGGSGGGLLQCENGHFELAGVVHGYVVQVEGKAHINIGDSTSIPSSAIKQFIQRANIKHVVGSR